MPESRNRPPRRPPAAPEVLAEEVTRLRDTFELAPVGMAHVSPAGELLRVNAAFAALFGAAAAELVGRRAQDLTHPADLAADLDQVVRCLSGEADAYHLTKRYLRADGSAFAARLHARLVRGPSADGLLPGPPFYFIAAVEPAEGDAAPEAAPGAAHADAGYRAAFEAIDQAFHRCEVIVDAEGRGVDYRLLDVNPAWARMTGFDPAGAVGRTCRELVPDAEEEWIAACCRAGLERVSIRLEQEIAALGMWYDVHLVPFGAPESRQFLATAADITARVRARELAERESGRVARLQALTAAVGAPLAHADVVRAVLDQASAGAGTVAGGVLTLDGAPGDPGAALVIEELVGYGADVRSRFARIPLDTPVPVCRAAAEGRPVYLTSAEEFAARGYLPPSPDGRGRVGAAWAALPLLLDDRCAGVLALTFDDPARVAPDERPFLEAYAAQCAQALERARLFEAERRARADAEAERARAEDASRAKSQFLANMSHELRTPLNAISGHVQLVELGLHGPVTDAQRDALGRAQAAQRHLLGLINAVLDLAKLESGRVDYALGPVAPAAVAAEAAALVEPQLRARGHALELRVPADAPAVLADRDKLRQVLLNLLSNAVKFTPVGGRITVDLPARGGGAQPDGVVFLRVADSGPGIPRDQQDAAFEPFVQVHDHAGPPASPYTRAAEGTGLGLTISRDLARGMGGDLRVRSRPGAGAAFTLALRRAHVPAD